MPPTCRRRPSELAVDVALYPHERFSRSFEWRQHSAAPTECCQRKKPSGKLGNAHGGTGRPVFRHAHIVIQPFVKQMSDILTQRAPPPSRAMSISNLFVFWHLLLCISLVPVRFTKFIIYMPGLSPHS